MQRNLKAIGLMLAILSLSFIANLAQANHGPKWVKVKSPYSRNVRNIMLRRVYYTPKNADFSELKKRIGIVRCRVETNIRVNTNNFFGKKVAKNLKRFHAIKRGKRAYTRMVKRIKRKMVRSIEIPFSVIGFRKADDALHTPKFEIKVWNTYPVFGPNGAPITGKLYNFAQKLFETRFKESQSAPFPTITKGTRFTRTVEYTTYNRGSSSEAIVKTSIKVRCR